MMNVVDGVFTTETIDTLRRVGFFVYQKQITTLSNGLLLCVLVLMASYLRFFVTQAISERKRPVKELVKTDLIDKIIPKDLDREILNAQKSIVPRKKSKKGKQEVREQVENIYSEIITKIRRLTRKIYAVLKSALVLIIGGILKYSYFVSLFALYVLDLTSEANVLHAVFLVFFILFIISEKASYKLWPVLIIYTHCVIICCYVFNVWFDDIVSPGESSGEHPKDGTETVKNVLESVGFSIYRNDFWGMWAGIWVDLCLLIVISLQFRIMRSSVVLTSFESEKKNIPNSLSKFFEQLWEYVKLLHPYVILSYVVLILLVSLQFKTSIFGLGFLLLFFMLIGAQFLLPFLFVITWYVYVFYVFGVFLVLYIYQFSFVQELVTVFYKVPDEYRYFLNLEDVGVFVFPFKQLNFLPYALLLILSIFQLYEFRIFRRRKKVPTITTAPQQQQTSSSYSLIFLRNLAIFCKRLCIIHSPKVVFIMLFIQSQTNISPIGFVFFLIVVIFAPFPRISEYIWFPILVLSELAILAQYLFQFPYFDVGIYCRPPVPVPQSDLPPTCQWLVWSGLKYNPPGTYVGVVIIFPILVIIFCLFQRICNDWKKEMIKNDEYVEGILINEDIEFTAKIFNKFKFLRGGLKYCIYLINHCFELYGYEICMFFMMVLSLILLRTVWGIIFFIMFGVTLLVGKRNVGKIYWTLTVLLTSFVLMVLYFFNFTAFPLYDYFENAPYFMYKEHTPYTIIFKWIVLHPDSDGHFPGVNDIQAFRIIIYVYVVLYFLALYLRVMYLKKFEKIKTVRSILNEEQSERKKMKIYTDYVEIPGAPAYSEESDFVNNPRNFWDRLRSIFLFTVFINLTLIVFFIDASIVKNNQNVVKLLQILIVLTILNFDNYVKWKTTKVWTWFGVFYLLVLFTYGILQILYCFEFVVEGDVVDKILNIIGFGLYDNRTNSYVIYLNILVFCFYYLQESIFSQRYYLLYTNKLYLMEGEKKIRHKKNEEFRAVRILENFVDHRRAIVMKNQLVDLINTYKLYVRGKEDDEDVLLNFFREVYFSNKKDPKSIENKIKLALKKGIDLVKKNPNVQSKVLTSDAEFMNELFEQCEKGSSYKDEERRLTESEEEEEEGEGESEDEGEGEKISKIEVEEKLPEDESPEVEEKPEEEIMESIVEEEIHLEEKESEGEDEEEGESQKDPVEIIIKKKLIEGEEKVKYWVPFGMTKVMYYVGVGLMFIIENGLIKFITIAVEKPDGIDPLSLEEKPKKEEEKKEEEGEEEEMKPLLEESEPDKEIEIKEKPKDEESDEESEKDEEVKKKEEEKVKKKKKEEKAAKKLEDEGKRRDAVEKYQKQRTIFLKQLKYFFNCIECLYLSQTQVLCYLVFVINLLVSSTIYNIIFTISCFGYAALQDSSQLYWELVLVCSQFFIGIEYVFEIVIKSLKEGYVPAGDGLEILGWGGTQSLLVNIFMYLIIVIVVNHHKSILVSRGDWVKRKYVEDLTKLTFLEDFTSHDNEEKGIRVVLDEKELQTDEEINKFKNFFTNLWSSFKGYFKRLLDNEPKLKKDLFVIQVVLYVLMVVIYVVFNRQISGNYYTKDFAESVQTNELSFALVLWLLIFFMVLVTERIVYIYVSLPAKLLFHYFLIIMVHVVFLTFSHLLAESGWFKAMMFIGFLILFVSALQIRFGYPFNTYEEFFTKSSNQIAYVLWQGYRAVPFLFEMLMLLNWTFKKTALSFYEWLQLEDIKTEVFRRKCILQSIRKRGSKELSKKVGDKQPFTVKLFSGFFFFVGICIVIFFPLFWFSTGNQYGFDNNFIKELRLRVGIRKFKNFYDNKVVYEHPGVDDTRSFSEWAGGYQSLDFMKQYDPKLPIQEIRLANYSEVLWEIATLSKLELVELLGDTEKHPDIEISTLIDIVRKGPQGAEDMSFDFTTPLDSDMRFQLQEMILTSKNQGGGLHLPAFYNPFMFNKATKFEPVSDMLEKFDKPDCILKVYNSTHQLENNFQYWTLICNRTLLTRDLNKVESAFALDIQSTKVPMSTDPVMSFLNGFGILAFYTTLVLAVGNFLRGMSAGSIFRLSVIEMEDVDILWRYVKLIYIAREQKDIKLEESMYRQLVRIFARNESIIKWSELSVKEEDDHEKEKKE